MQRKYNRNVDVGYQVLIWNIKNCSLGCPSWLLQMKPYLILMRIFPGSIVWVLRDASYSFMIRARRGMRGQSENKAYAIRSQAPFIFPPQSLSHPFPLFQFSQQPSYLRASLPLGWAIASLFYLFLLKHSLDCIPRPRTGLRLLPYYLSKCNVLASGALGNLTPNCSPTLGSHLSSQRISCYLHTQILHSLQISHLLVC